MLAATKKAYDDMQLQEDKTQAAVTRAFDQKFKLLKEERFHKENLALITQVGGIEAENEAMKKQEESLKRMISLRSELASEATKAARQEVELTKLKGGDVALAEANALATSMAGELQKLNDNLADAKLKTTDATRQEVLAAKALDLLEKDVTRGASENYNKEVEKAREYAKLTTEKGAEARELLKGAFAKYDASHTSIIRGAEIDLEKKETEYSGKISPAANKAFGEFFKTLQTELAKPQPQMVEAIAQITADSQKIVDATTAKTTEIGTQMDAAKTATVGAVEKISSNATQHAAAIDSSVSLASAQVKEALDLQTERILTALGKVAAACVENANRAKLADRRIDQLLARR